MHVARPRQQQEKQPQQRRVRPPRPVRQVGHRKEAGEHFPGVVREETAAPVRSRREALGDEAGREDEPQRRQNHQVVGPLPRRLLHPEHLRVEPLRDGQQHAQQQERQNQVHDEGERLASGERLLRRVEIPEKDGEVNRVERACVVHHRLDFPENDEQEPAEGERHVHVAQQRVDPEDAPVEQRFAHHLAQGVQRPAGGESLQNEHLVGTRQFLGIGAVDGHQGIQRGLRLS